MRQAGASLHRGAWASHCRGLSCCGAQAPDAQAQQLWLTGLVAPRHVGSFQTRARTRVPCIGRRIPNHCATREAPMAHFLNELSVLGAPPRVLPAPHRHPCASGHRVATEAPLSSSKLLSNARALLGAGSLLLRSLPSSPVALLTHVPLPFRPGPACPSEPSLQAPRPLPYPRTSGGLVPPCRWLFGLLPPVTSVATSLPTAPASSLRVLPSCSCCV